MAYRTPMFIKYYRFVISMCLFLVSLLPTLSAAQELNEIGKLKITEVLENGLEEFKIPGFVALVTNSDRIIYS